MGRVFGVVACVFFLLAGVLVSPAAAQDAEPPPAATTTTVGEPDPAPATSEADPAPAAGESTTTTESESGGSVTSAIGTTIVEADESTTTTASTSESDAEVEGGDAGSQVAEAELEAEGDKPVEEDPFGGELVGAEPPAFDPDWEPEVSVGVDVVSGELNPIDAQVAEDAGRESVPAPSVPDGVEVPDSGELLIVEDFEFELPVFAEREVRLPLEAGRPGVVEGLPITVSPRATDVSVVSDRRVGAGPEVQVEPAGRELAAALSEVGLLFRMNLSGFGNDLGVSDLVGAEGVSPILGEGSGWSVEIDPAAFEAAPADLRDRLMLRVFSGCDEKGCEISELLETTRSGDGMIVAVIPVEVLAAVGGPRRDGARQELGGVFESRSSSFAAMTNPLNVYFGVSSGTGGAQGDYSASSLESLVTYQVGLSTGYAESSYSIPVPPAVGPSPTVAFSYSSGAVDGMNTNANNQASQLGLGWSHANPVVTRATRSCTDQGAEGDYEHNLCLPGGRHDGFSLSMNGVGGRLVRTSSSTAAHPTYSGAQYHEYVLESANGWRIWKVELAAAGVDGAAGGIPDRWGTWWEITTEDGTLHVFGRNWVMRNTNTSGHPLQQSRSVHTDVELGSVLSAPIYEQSSGSASSDCVNDLCTWATAWYLDQTIDTHGNQLVQQYWRELNYFDANRPGGTSRLSYARSVNLSEIYYGRTFGSTFGSGNKFRVHFDYTGRSDVPLDLTCGASGSCDKNSPSFFSSVRLGWVQTYALGNSPSSIAGRWNLQASVPQASTDPDDVDKLQLDEIRRVDPSNTSVGLNPVEFTYEMKANRVNHPSGVPEMQMQRLKTITNELDGIVTFTYGQPYPPIPGGSASQACSAGATPTGGYVRMPCNMFIAYDAHTGGGGFVLWNSYVVTKQRTDPNFGQSHTYEELTFTYQTPPNWRYSGTWGHTEYDSAQCKLGYGCNHWNDYRGHERVRVTDRAGNITEHFFYTGMREDRYSVSNPAQLVTVNPSAPEVNTLDPGLGNRANYRHLSGRSLGSRQLTSSGGLRSRITTLYGTTNISGTSWPYSHRDTYLAEYPAAFGMTGGSATGKITTFYDSNSQVLRVVDEGQRWGLGATTADDHTTFYYYSANTSDWIVGLPYKISTQPGVLSSLSGTAPIISQVAMRYDQNPYFGTPPQQGEVEVRNTQLDTSTQRSERFTYYDNGLVHTEKVILPGTDAVTTYGYDSFGNLASVDGPLEDDDPNTTGPIGGDLTTFTTDARFGAQTVVNAPNSQTTEITLDTYGRTAAVQYPDQTTDWQWFNYYPSNPSTPALVRTKSRNESGEFIWSWEFYDGFSRPIQTQTVAENGTAINVVSSGYDLAGREYWVTQPYQEPSGAGVYQGYPLANTNRTVWTYNTDGAVRTRLFNTSNQAEIDSTTTTRGWETTSTDPLGNTTVSVVNLDGNLTSVTDANNQTTTYAYNVRGDLTTITDPVGNQITNTYTNWSTQVTQMTDPDLGTITYDYDIAGRLESQTDARGNALFVTYNVASQPTELRLGSASGTVVSEWDYDNSGRMEGTTHHNIRTGGASAGTVETSLTYDARNRVVNKSWTIPDLPGGTQDIDYTYRPLGAIDTITYPNGTVVDYAFNKETEQPVSVTVDGTTVASGVRYNPAGQVSFIQRGQPDWDGSNLGQLGTTFEYDYAQRIESISTVGLDEPDATDDALVRLYRAAFDRDPDAAGWGHWLPQYAGGLPLANIAQAFHDSSEFPATWTDFDATVQDLSDNFDFVMWMYGHIIDRQPGNRSGWSWWQTQLDNGNWTRGQAIAHFTGLAEALNNPGIGGTDATTPYAAPNPANADVPQELAYTWDDAGNLTRVHETSEGVDQWQCFTYDNLHRLDLGYIHGSSACGAYQAIGPDPFNVDYAYNSIGNITSASGTGTVGGSYTYSSTKPHAVTQAGSNSYAYDAAGNMTTRTTSIGTQTLVYDVLNRLVEITGAGADMTALYDADGVRVKRDLDGDTVYYLTDTYEINDPATGPDSETIHFTLAGVTVGSDIDGTLYVSASDHLGSGSISRNGSGVTATQRYTPYGAIRGGGSNGLPSDFTFTGQTDDPGTGLIDYNARHYDPQLGRFITADPILDGLNRYTYVKNNPLAYTDPSGNVTCRSNFLTSFVCGAGSEVRDTASGVVHVATNPVETVEAVAQSAWDCGGQAVCLVQQTATAEVERLHQDAEENGYASAFGRLAPAVIAAVATRGASRGATAVDDVAVAGRPRVPNPSPVRRPSGAPNRDSPWWVNVVDPDGNLHTVGNANGVHAEIRIQQMFPGSQMSAPYGWRTVDEALGPQWVEGTVCASCQQIPRSVFNPGTRGAKGGAWSYE